MKCCSSYLMVEVGACAGKRANCPCWPVGEVRLGSADVNACSLHGKDATCVR